MVRVVVVGATLQFDKWARRVLTASEYEALRAYLVAHPEAGPVIAGTGGARKLRWAVGGRGKRGGARLI